MWLPYPSPRPPLLEQSGTSLIPKQNTGRVEVVLCELVFRLDGASQIVHRAVEILEKDATEGGGTVDVLARDLKVQGREAGSVRWPGDDRVDDQTPDALIPCGRLNSKYAECDYHLERR